MAHALNVAAYIPTKTHSLGATMATEETAVIAGLASAEVPGAAAAAAAGPAAAEVWKARRNAAKFLLHVAGTEGATFIGGSI